MLALALYWYIPYATVENSRTRHHIEGERIFWGIFSTVIGVCLMIGADCQKFVQLKYKKGLVCDGFFSRTRNPNYLGEIMIYGGFGIIAKDTMSWLILLTIWTVLFGSGILQKELSYMRKEGWEQYKNQSLILLPRITADYWQNYMIYGGLAVVAFVFYLLGGFFTLFGFK